MYHIRIEGEQDGAILDVEVEHFYVIYEDDNALHQRTRGQNAYETIGYLVWGLEGAKRQVIRDDRESEPLIDET